MKKLICTLTLVAVGLSLLMYPQTHLALRHGLENAFVMLRLSSFSYEALPAVPVDAAKTQVVFMFDDGWASVYTDAYPLLARYGYSASIAAIPGMAREREYLSYAQLARMYMDGWDILNHSYSHKDGMYARCDELLSEYMSAREWLDRRFFRRGGNSVIMPFGDCNPYIIPLLIKNGFQNIRTSDNVLLLDRDEVCYFPIKTIHLLTDVSVETVTAELTACAGGDSAVLFNLHKMGDGADRTQMTFSPAKLREIVEFLHANEDTFQVVTYLTLLE
ncbi:MAG: polysaccharide deacetylase family protein [Eubacteriales bacterium]|nr:polysaccharide deacetylase family protein [Eubacteriales bacterium]